MIQNLLGLLVTLLNDLLYLPYRLYLRWALNWQSDNAPDPDSDPSASRQSAKVVGVGRVGKCSKEGGCSCPKE